MSLSLRPAAVTDLPFVLDCTRDLAAIEGRPEACTSSVDDLARMLFAPGSPSRCFIIIKPDLGPIEPGSDGCRRPGGERVGHAWLTVRVSTFGGCTSLYIDDIVIASTHRNQGLGRKAMALLASLALAEGHRSLTWSAVRDNTDAHRFYDRLGASRVEGSISFKMDGGGLADLASEARVQH